MTTDDYKTFLELASKPSMNHKKIIAYKLGYKCCLLPVKELRTIQWFLVTPNM